jgi:hypothetical protein
LSGSYIPPLSFEVADFDRANMSSRNHLDEDPDTHNRPR